MLLHHLPPMSVAALLAATASAQHCGGPCEVPRGAAPVSAEPRFTLTPGPEKTDWRYLWNWIWTEDGEPVHRLEKTLRALPCRDFGYRRMFVSPAGNGLLVTGNPYAGDYLGGEEPPLFVFCDPEGRRLVEISLSAVLTDEERQTGKCPGCDCADVLYVFARDPQLSDDGCFVELAASQTQRRIGFFLPLGLPVLDRAAFEVALTEAEWASLAAPERDRQRSEIEALVRRLRDDDAAARAAATDALVAKGFLALAAVRHARSDAGSEDLRRRADAIERRLRPWTVAGWDAMAIDLGLLGSLLSYPDEHVVRAVQSRLQRILPPSTGMDAAACASWIREHRDDLKWNAAERRYEE